MSTPEKRLLAYFSHSYRSTEKKINLFFWELLSRHGLYFTVDPKEKNGAPMDITYLEWMMRRSACFVAVIPARPGKQGKLECSPYQLFENSIAIRSRKPRLIFVEGGLDAHLFGVSRDEAPTFPRDPTLRKGMIGEFERLAERLIKQVGAFDPPSEYHGSIALVVDTSADGRYKSLRTTLKDRGYDVKIEDPSDFRQDHSFMWELEKHDVLISEVRLPYIRPEIYGLIHGRCLPTIRICFLADDEDKERAKEMMRLSLNLSSQISHGGSGSDLPILLSKYQIDEGMEPIIFWKQGQEGELADKIEQRLLRIRERRRDLVSEKDARDYFLEIGRQEGQVFISNASQNDDFVRELKERFEEQDIKKFHYRDLGAIDAGRPDWEAAIRTSVDESVAFVALIDRHYTQSKECLWELDLAVKNEGTQLLPYLIEKDVRVPEILKKTRIQAEPVFTAGGQSAQIERIVEEVIRYLEKGGKHDLSDRDLRSITKTLASLGAFSTAEGRVEFMEKAGLPKGCIAALSTDQSNVVVGSDDWVARLLGWLTENRLDQHAMGRILARAVPHLPLKKQQSLADVIRSNNLLPDLRLLIHSPTVRELCVALHREGDQHVAAIFRAVIDKRPEGGRPERSALSSKLFAHFARLTGKQNDWRHSVAVIGEELQRNRIFKQLATDYQEALDIIGNSGEQLGFCFASDATGLAVPVEWMPLRPKDPPLCLRHPVRRFLIVNEKPRAAISKLIDDYAIPLRVLIIAANTGGVPKVIDEAEIVRRKFVELFEKLGWPTDNVKVLLDSEATPDKLERVIQEGNYHLMHFAGHSEYENGQPRIVVYKNPSNKERAYISARELREWASKSDLRMVYLSCCRSADSQFDAAPIIGQFGSLIQAVAEAQVPEIVGFTWPISDEQSSIFADKFYTEYLQTLDPSLAAFRARQSVDEEYKIWAAPIVIQNADSLPVA